MTSVEILSKPIMIYFVYSEQLLELRIGRPKHELFATENTILSHFGRVLEDFGEKPENTNFLAQNNGQPNEIVLSSNRYFY